MPNILPEAMSSSDRMFGKRKRRRKVAIRITLLSSSPALTLSSSLPLILALCANSVVSPSSVPPSTGGHCAQWVNDGIQQCVQPVADFAKTLNKEQQTETAVSSSSAVPSSEFGQALQWPTKMGGQVFGELCRLINNFELCVDGFRKKCRRHITISLIEASYGFLCNEGYDTFMASAECLMELDQRPNVKRCHDRTLKSIESANTDEKGGAVGTKLDKMCSALNYFSDCVRTPIRQSCGVEAWQVIFRVLKDTTRTLMPKCQFEETNEMKETAERAQKEEENGRDEGERGWTIETEGGMSPAEGERQKAMKMDGRRGSAIERANAMARQNANKLSTTTTNNPFEQWERWEEEEKGDSGTVPFANERNSELHHQIHYGSQMISRNGATVAKCPSPVMQRVMPILLISIPLLFSVVFPFPFHFIRQF